MRTQNTEKIIWIRPDPDPQYFYIVESKRLQAFLVPVVMNTVAR